MIGDGQPSEGAKVGRGWYAKHDPYLVRALGIIDDLVGDKIRHVIVIAI